MLGAERAPQGAVMKVSQMQTPGGRPAPNQFIVFSGEDTIFQSYDTVIVRTSFEGGQRMVELDRDAWKRSVTTSKYRAMFLGESTRETQKKIDSGEYLLTNLNPQSKVKV